MKSIFAIAILYMVALPAAASGPTREELQLPPATYAEPVFLHPNGCLYTRADPAGYGRRWIAISNGFYIVPGARDGTQCTTMLYQPRG